MLLILGFRNLPFTVTNDGVKTVSCIKLFSLFGGILLDKVPGSVIANSKDEDIFVLDVYCKDNSPALYLPPWKKKIPLSTPFNSNMDIRETYFRIRTVHHRIWAGQVDRPSLTR